MSIQKGPSNPWWPGHRPLASARHKLICFPFAGGSSAAYRSWLTKLAPDVEVCAVELPGRAHRFGEVPARNMATLLPELARALERIVDARPFAFFGHSMGSILAFEFARFLAREGRRGPSRLFLSGTGPEPDPEEKRLHRLDDTKLVARLRELGGIPEEVYQNQELMALVLPVLRADLELVEAFPFEPERSVGVPIHALGGDADKEVPVSDIELWAKRTSAPASVHILPGGHFFLRDQEEAVLNVVKKALG